MKRDFAAGCPSSENEALQSLETRKHKSCGGIQERERYRERKRERKREKEERERKRKRGRDIGHDKLVSCS
jgi:hypothetical protein